MWPAAGIRSPENSTSTRGKAGSSTPQPDATASEVTYESDEKCAQTSPAGIRLALPRLDGARHFLLQPGSGAEVLFARADPMVALPIELDDGHESLSPVDAGHTEIGRASCRERV